MIEISATKRNVTADLCEEDYHTYLECGEKIPQLIKNCNLRATESDQKAFETCKKRRNHDKTTRFQTLTLKFDRLIAECCDNSEKTSYITLLHEREVPTKNLIRFFSHNTVKPRI